jgi:hypothetical protein
MHRSCLFIPVLMLVPAPVFGQSTSTDSQTLQALLAEVRQLRHDLQTTTIAAQRDRFFSTVCKGRKRPSHVPRRNSMTPAQDLSRHNRIAPD